MDTLDFFTRIIAPANELVICTHKPDPKGLNPRGMFWNRGSFTDRQEAADAALAWDREPNTTVYYGVATFAGHEYTENGKTKWRRTQSMAQEFKALALDLDIGPDKPYATQREGWLAMDAALKAIGMPDPMVVSSGNGIHLYWPLTEPIPTRTWERMSIALRLALDAHSVVIDTSKIHDPSMVLRPVGTHHKKQQPWKLVECKRNCPDYDPTQLVMVLKPWANQSVAKTPARVSGKPKSSILGAVLNSNDVNIRSVATVCKQVNALLESGGVTDAMGRPVEEPLWRASLGLAKHATDPQEAVIMLAGQHPDFDLDDSMAKMAGWNGSGPTTCAKFEQLCSGGCAGCPKQGKITSPAQLTFDTVIEIQTEAAELPVHVQMPKGYVVSGHTVQKEIEVVDPESGEAHIEHETASPRLMVITGIFKDPESGRSTAKLSIETPQGTWEEEAHDLSAFAVAGKDFSSLLINRQVFIHNMGQIEKVRRYLMDYLTMVQQQAPSGVDYTSFGWQPDGSFMCGPELIGGPKAGVEVRLRGAAQAYETLIGKHGDRDEWVRAMAMLDRPGTETIRSATLLATTGLLGPASGNATLVVSIYSTETTTGKTLSLIAANSLVGSPRELLLNRKDTANAMYKIRGVLNHLPACMDEVTTADDKDIADMLYDFSQGREKVRMSKDGALRDPATWAGPTLMSTNISLHQKVEAAQAGNEPLKARCLELGQHDRAFVTPREGQPRSDAYEFFEIVAKNNGWAFPELIDGIQRMGGPQYVWDRAEESFNRVIGFDFQPQERFYRTAIISAWALGRMGAGMGLFPFNINETIYYLCDQVERLRKVEIEHKVDVFDTVGQFLAEHNDQIVEARSKYGVDAEQVTMPAPERAVARVKVVSDGATPVMPGSYIAINAEQFRIWLGKKRDGMDRIERALEAEGALLKRRERITMFKGCPKHAPGQAQCLIVNLNHPRFIESLSGLTARTQSKVTLAVLNGENAA